MKLPEGIIEKFDLTGGKKDENKRKMWQAVNMYL